MIPASCFLQFDPRQDRLGVGLGVLLEVGDAPELCGGLLDAVPVGFAGGCADGDGEVVPDAVGVTGGAGFGGGL